MSDNRLKTVDEPFSEELPFPLSQQQLKRSPSVTMLCVVPCPRGDKLVDPSWLEEETVIMSREQLEYLLGVDRRPTVRSMQAVMPPSSRPDPASLVSVLEKP